MNDRGREIVLYLPSLPVGGAERMLVRLAAALIARGRDVTILLDRMEGGMLESVPKGVGLESLDAGRSVAAIPRLAGWLRRESPEILLSALSHQNIVAVIARWLARSPTRIVVSEHTMLSRQSAETPGWQHRIMPTLASRLYTLADARVAVSGSALGDLVAITGLPRARFDLIYNPVVPDELLGEGLVPLSEDRWFQDGGPPVLVAAGRLVPLKDFPTLLRAFALLRAGRPVRLVILGEGPSRPELERLSNELGLGDDVRMPGAVVDTLPWFAAASAVISASRYEGFGVVLVEAMACGTPVVSTDCPGGPAEILEDGRLGPLVPVGDAPALARGMARALDEPVSGTALRARARDFSVSRSADGYEALFDRLDGSI